MVTNPSESGKATEKEMEREKMQPATTLVVEAGGGVGIEKKEDGVHILESMSMNMSMAASPQEVHVLVVDDNPIDRMVAGRELKASCYRVTAVESALKALEVLGVGGGSYNRMNASHINLIITDYCMPDMTGFDLLKKLKEIPSLRDIPVVIMSSENVEARVESCLAEGAEEFLLKPLKKEKIDRLRGYIRAPPKAASTEQTPPTSTPLCAKRKVISSEGLPSQSSERRPRLEVVGAASTEQTPPTSTPLCAKRKVISSEGLPSQSSERRPRLEVVTVT